MSNKRIAELQQKLSENMRKVVELAEKNTVRNKEGYVVFANDEINDMEEFLGLDELEPIQLNSDYVSDFNDWYNEELSKLYNTYKLADKDKSLKILIEKYLENNSKETIDNK